MPSCRANVVARTGSREKIVVTVAEVAIGLLRQQLTAGVRMHGPRTRGGEAPNAIPQRTEGRFRARRSE